MWAVFGIFSKAVRMILQVHTAGVKVSFNNFYDLVFIYFYLAS